MKFRSSFVMLALVSLSFWLLSGCYSRAELKPRVVQPKSTISMNFTVDPGLEEQFSTFQKSSLVSQQSVTINGQNQGDAQVQQLKSLPVSLAGQLRSDLLKYKIAVPSTKPEDANLSLTGMFRFDPTYGVALDWQMVETTQGSVVHVGVAHGIHATDPTFYTDQILEPLVKMDLNRFAGNGTMVAGTTSALPSEGVDDPPASGTNGEDAWAVVIGIENYREGLAPASHAEDDARAFAAYVERTLNVPPSHIKTLVGERASRADIASALEEWLPRNAVKPGGKVYVFFSGHGAPDVESGDAYLVPYDADPAYLKTRGYAIQKLYKMLDTLPEQQSLVFLDACFSGSGDRSVLAAGTRPLVPVKTPQAAKGIISLAASQASQTTGASERSAHGLFTHHLLAGMQGKADANGDKSVTIQELAGYITTRVEEEARLQNREQTPSLTVPGGVDPSSVTLVKGLQ